MARHGMPKVFQFISAKRRDIAFGMLESLLENQPKPLEGKELVSVTNAFAAGFAACEAANVAINLNQTEE